MSISASDLIWSLVGAAIGTVTLAIFFWAILKSEGQRLSAAQRFAVLLVFFLVIFTTILLASGLARPRSLASVTSQGKSMTELGSNPPPAVVGATNGAKGTAGEAVTEVNIFMPNADPAAPWDVPSETIARPPEPHPESRSPAFGQPAADEVIHYQDYRDFRGDHFVRLGDAKIIKKGAIYFLDLGPVAGLPNEVKIADNDQAKVRKWLGE